MHLSVADFVGPLTSEQREALDTVLVVGERIVWATRPTSRLLLRTQHQHACGKLIVCAVLCFLLVVGLSEILKAVPWLVRAVTMEQTAQGSWLQPVVVLALLSVVCLSCFLCGRYILLHLSSLLALYAKRRHTLYVLTNKRAITLEPELTTWAVATFSLQEDMILRRRQTRAGGVLIFRLMADGREVGWYGLQHLELAEKKIHEALTLREAE